MTRYYLFVFEDGNVKSASNISEDDATMSIDGYIDIIDITDPSNPCRVYFNDSDQPELRPIDKCES